MLISKRFMSQLMTSERVTLGHREEQFLRMIAIAKEMSTYDIYFKLNEGKTDNGRARKLPQVRFSHQDSMSYKNVHKRVKRLQELNLIEQIKEVRHRNKIKYELTPYGLLQFFASTVSHPVFSLPELLKKYKNNEILQTFLFQYFRMETIMKLIKIFHEFIFLEYLRKCCEHIFTVNIGAGMLTKKQFEAAIKIKTDTTNYLIEKELKSLINEIVTNSIDPSYKDYFPDRDLIEDDKFMHLVENLRNDFRKGCKNFFYSPSNLT